jgi:spermidine synthase
MLTSIFISGLSGIVAQVLILRELLVSFYGNELTLGIILGNWIIAEAVGVISMGKIIERINDRARIFIILVLLFCFSLPLALYFARVFKIILGLPLGQGLSLFTVFWISLAINFFPAFFHGALFSAACKIYSKRASNSASGVSKVYALETSGTALGGVALTYVFLPYFNYFQIVFAICIMNFIACSLVADYVSSVRLKNYIIGSLIVLSSLLIFIGPCGIERHSLSQKYSPGKLLLNQNSVFGNIAVVQSGKQRTFYYDGLPIITTPYPDINFVEDFGNLAMLFHNLPQKVLLISGGSGGLIREILKHPLVSLDYLEIDPLLIRTLKAYPSGIINQEFKDRRLHVILKDGRHYLKQTSDKFDLILIGIPYPSGLANNRFFTEEFFRQTSKRLKSSGIIGLTLPGSRSYLSPQLKDLNSCVYYAMTAVFKYVRLIPGDYNLILGSFSKNIIEVDANLIIQRIKERNLKTNILNPAYIDYRLDHKWVQWYAQSARKAIKKINQDFAPFAVFKMTDYWNKKFSPSLSWLFALAQNLNLKQLFLPP